MKDIYKQDYCGCVFGLKEQVIKKQERDERDRTLFRKLFAQHEHLWQFRGQKLKLSAVKVRSKEELKKLLEILKPSSLVVESEYVKTFALTGKWLKCGKYNCRIERR